MVPGRDERDLRVDRSDDLTAVRNTSAAGIALFITIAPKLPPACASGTYIAETSGCVSELDRTSPTMPTIVRGSVSA
jgi:hypothetical protein